MLAQRSAIVTGSTSGIGLGIARALAQNGADVLLNGFGKAQEIESTRVEMERLYGVKVRYSGADMSRPEQIRAMAEMARAEFGKIDIIVNNAGIQHVAPIEDFPDEQWDAVLAINLSSAFHLIKAVTPGMKARRFGRVVNIASAHGLTASPFKSAYVAAKHGLIGLSKTVAIELAEFGVTANTICPGYVKTPLVEKQIADQAKAHGISPEQVVREVMLSHARAGRRAVRRG
jgi:3-hydroxybutyrate dehydrogenase